MKKSLLFAAVAAAVLATGCSKKDDVRTTDGEAPGAIAFRGVVDKSTRATSVSSTAELTNFFVQAGSHASAAFPTSLSFMEASVYKNGSSWTYAPLKYYPSNGDAVNFYAHAPVKDVNMTAEPAVVGGTRVQFGYTVPTDQGKDNTAVDLLVASALDQVAQATPTSVALTFNHALSAVTFSAANRNTATGAGGELTYVIKKIEITKMYNTGAFAYPYSASSWTASGARNNTYIAGLPEAGVALEPIGLSAAAQKLLSANDLMMVLPQTVTAGTVNPDNTPSLDETFVRVTYSLRDGASGGYIFEDAVRRLTLPANYEFKPGVRYNFEFAFGSASNPRTAISFTVTVNDWTDEPTQAIPQP